MSGATYSTAFDLSLGELLLITDALVDKALTINPGDERQEHIVALMNKLGYPETASQIGAWRALSQEHSVRV